MKRILSINVSALALLAGLSQPAFAQSTDEPAAAEAAKAVPVEPIQTKAKAKATEEEEDIIVTGTRLPSEFSTTSPVQVLKTDTGAVAGAATAAELLARATSVAGTQQINNQFAATGAGGGLNPGGQNINSISLRNLGATRTLSLMDGQRIAPAGVGSQVAPVDFNVIPSVIIDRIEVLTTGASAIYGSDAISGVVNVITRKGGKGLELTGFTRLPGNTGGKYYNLSGYWGKNFDNAYIGIGIEYDRQFELNLKDRPETACSQSLVYNPTTGARADALDQAGNFKCFNHNATGVFFDRFFYGGMFIYDPTLANGPYPAAALNLRNTSNPNFAPLLDWVRGGRAGRPDTFTYTPTSSAAYDEADSISPFQRFNAHLSAGVDVGENSELYFRALFSRRTSETNSWSFLYPFLAATNPNNTVGFALFSISGGGSTGDIQPQIVRPFLETQKVDFFQATAGFKGSFTGGVLNNWKYDISARYGRSRGTYGLTFYYNDRLNAATGPGVACDPSQITVSGPTTCVSIPWLTKRFLVDANWTDAERNFLEGFEYGTTAFDEFAVDASLAGKLFSLPAGDVAAVFGAAIRTDKLDDRPGPNAQKQNYFARSTAGRTTGSDTVKEIFGELGIPILADKTFIRRLNVTLSGRFTDYKSYGSNTTFRVAGVWEPERWLAFRGSYGTSYRAPSIYELNLADQSSFFNYFDPCFRYGESTNPTVIANCRAEGFAPDFAPQNSGITGISGGGRGVLKAETSTNLNLGLVFKPGFANLQIALDYYDIKVRNEVDTFGVNSVVNSCYALQGAQRTTFCSQITRDPLTRAITVVRNPYLNLSQQRARGLDFSLDMNFPLSKNVEAGFNLRANRALENSIIRDALTPELERNGFSGNPKLTGNAEIWLNWNKLTLYFGGRYVGKVDDTPYYTGEDLFIPGTTNFRFYGAYSGRNAYGNPNDFAAVRELLTVPAYTTFYTSVRWKLAEKTTLLAGIDNIFGKRPPVIGPDSWTFRIGSVAGNQYNITGRSMFLRINQGF